MNERHNLVGGNWAVRPGRIGGALLTATLWQDHLGSTYWSGIIVQEWVSPILADWRQFPTFIYLRTAVNFRLKDVKKCLFTTIVLYEIKLKRSQGSYFSLNCPIFYLSFDIALSTSQKVAFIDFFQPSIGGISGPHVGDESSIWNTVVSTLENNNLSSCP